VIALPPVLAGATQVTTTDFAPPVTATPVGAPGAVRAADVVAEPVAAGDVPIAFTAETETVYKVASASPEMVHVVADAATVPQVLVEVPAVAETV
jgi:hypothetical protein